LTSPLAGFLNSGFHRFVLMPSQHPMFAVLITCTFFRGGKSFSLIDLAGALVRAPPSCPPFDGIFDFETSLAGVVESLSLSGCFV